MKTFASAFAIGLLCAVAPASAQEKVFRSVEAPPGKQARLALIGNVSKECTPGPKPEVKVVTAPKNGTLSIRSGKTKPGSLARCPNLEVPAEGVFYTPNPSFSGTDEVVYSVTRSDGRNQLVTIRITVTGKAKPAPRSQGATDI
jgi:Bacterial Ig domain